MLAALLIMVASAAADPRDWHTKYTSHFSRTYWACQRGAGEGDHIHTKCAWEEYRRRDTELNAVYKTVIADLPTQGALDLRAGQRKWIVQRDATCTRIRIAQPGTIALHLEPQCLADQTIRRTIWLEHLR